jgi:hypothetical protein
VGKVGVRTMWAVLWKYSRERRYKCGSRKVIVNSKKKKSEKIRIYVKGKGSCEAYRNTPYTMANRSDNMGNKIEYREKNPGATTFL